MSGHSLVLAGQWTIPAWAVLLGAYLLGSIPFGWIVVRLKTGRDVREVGSGNIGATNTLRAAGKTAGIVTLALDLAKGIAAVLLARQLGASPLLVSGAAAASVVGHMYPVWLRFRGGKGVATAAGALGALAPLAALLSLGVFAAMVSWKRYVSLASIAAVTTFPLFVLALGAIGDAPHDLPFLVSSAAVPALVVWRHRLNVQRLLAGSERRLGDPLEPTAGALVAEMTDEPVADGARSDAGTTAESLEHPVGPRR